MAGWDKRKAMGKNKDKIQQKYTESDRTLVIGCICSVAFILCIAASSMLFFRESMQRSERLLENTDAEAYDAYYVMISSDRSSAFWRSVYESAREEGRKKGVYVEMLGDNLSTDYSREDLLGIAIASNVDGIILEGDESGITAEYLETADEKGIPVVTVLKDNSQGIRKSFVGVSNYNLGREYGRQVLSIADKEVKDVLVLMSADAQDSGQNIIFSGIQETLEQDGGGIRVRTAAVENKGAFDAEESIRHMFLETELPDVVICLEELFTSCTYQAVVDYNLVGEMDIIGFYDSETILKAIERNVVRSTISIDTQEMGQYCVQALNEYRSNGYVSEYFGVGTNLITTQNVREYLGGGAYEQNP